MRSRRKRISLPTVALSLMWTASGCLGEADEYGSGGDGDPAALLLAGADDAIVDTSDADATAGRQPVRACEAASGRPPAGASPCASVPIGYWKFDDCSSASAELADSSEQMHSALRSPSVACTEGRMGRAVIIEESADIVRVPDQREYAPTGGVTVALWVKSRFIGGSSIETLFRKERDVGNGPFALILNGGQYQFVVRLGARRTVTVASPAIEGKWTHVAATYDRTYLRLYVNGVEVARTRAPGQLYRGAGDLLIGNNDGATPFSGEIDSAWFNTLAAPAATIQSLAAEPSCVPLPPLVTASPMTSPAVQPGVTVTYAVSITNQNPPSCVPESYQTAIGLGAGRLTSSPRSMFVSTLASTQSVVVPVAVTSPLDIVPGSYPVVFRTVPMVSPQAPPDVPRFSLINAFYVVGP